LRRAFPATTRQAANPAQQPLKIWDGFTVKVETDGAWISFGDSYRYWLSFS
jgi:hypothetical protein